MERKSETTVRVDRRMAGVTFLLELRSDKESSKILLTGNDDSHDTLVAPVNCLPPEVRSDGSLLSASRKKSARSAGVRTNREGNDEFVRAR